MTGFPPAVIRELKKRSNGICEGCGVSQATQAHHRQYRSRGGPDTVENGLRLCGSGNHTGCHGAAHTAKGEARGWSVRSGFNPAEVPVFLIIDYVGGWYLLGVDGGREPISEVNACELLAAFGIPKAGA